MIGSTKGSVINMAAISSNTAPRMRYATSSAKMMTMGETVRPPIRLISASGTRAMVM